MRRNLARAAALACALALAGCAHLQPDTGKAAPVQGDPVETMVREVDRYRASRGLPALTWDDRLAEVARRHCEDMIRRQYFAHVNPDGKTPFDRMRGAGLTFRSAGENIALGRDPMSVFNSWVSSPGHRKNLESRAFTHHGLAKVGNYWTHEFIQPR